MQKMYLISREDNEAANINQVDISKLGNYVAVNYGEDSYFQTFDAAFNHLYALAKTNIRNGVTALILDTTGEVIYKMSLVFNETDLRYHGLK